MVRKDGKKPNTIKGELRKGHHRFIKEYLKDFNGTRAYRDAKIRKGVVKKRTAVARASQLLRDYKIRTEIDKKITEMFCNLDIESESVLAQQAILAFIDSRSLFNDDGSLKHIKDMNIAEQSVIESLEIEELFNDEGEPIGRVKKVKFYSRQKALDNLMKYKKLMGDGGTNINLMGDKIKLTIASEKLEKRLGADKVIELAERLEAAE